MMKRWTGADARLLVPSLEPKYLRTDGRKDNQEPPTFTLEIGTEILEFNNDVKKVKYTYVHHLPPKVWNPKVGFAKVGCWTTSTKIQGQRSPWICAYSKERSCTVIIL